MVPDWNRTNPITSRIGLVPRSGCPRVFPRHPNYSWEIYEMPTNRLLHETSLLYRDRKMSELMDTRPILLYHDRVWQRTARVGRAENIHPGPKRMEEYVHTRQRVKTNPSLNLKCRIKRCWPPAIRETQTIETKHRIPHKAKYQDVRRSPTAGDSGTQHRVQIFPHITGTFTKSSVRSDHLDRRRLEHVLWARRACGATAP